MSELSLKELVEQTGLKKVAIAEELGINRVSLYRKLMGQVRFTQEELDKLNKLLERNMPSITRRLAPMPVRREGE